MGVGHSILSPVNSSTWLPAFGLGSVDLITKEFQKAVLTVSVSSIVRGAALRTYSDTVASGGGDVFLIKNNNQKTHLMGSASSPKQSEAFSNYSLK